MGNLGAPAGRGPSQFYIDRTGSWALLFSTTPSDERSSMCSLQRKVLHTRQDAKNMSLAALGGTVGQYK
eukprot:767288-Amphidinium_carterae.1